MFVAVWVQQCPFDHITFSLLQSIFLIGLVQTILRIESHTVDKSSLRRASLTLNPLTNQTIYSHKHSFARLDSKFYILHLFDLFPSCIYSTRLCWFYQEIFLCVQSCKWFEADAFSTKYQLKLVSVDLTLTSKNFHFF